MAASCLVLQVRLKKSSCRETSLEGFFGPALWSVTTLYTRIRLKSRTEGVSEVRQHARLQLYRRMGRRSRAHSSATRNLVHPIEGQQRKHQSPVLPKPKFVRLTPLASRRSARLCKERGSGALISPAFHPELSPSSFLRLPGTPPADHVPRGNIVTVSTSGTLPVALPGHSGIIF